MPLVVSVMGFGRDELAGLVEGVAARDEVALIELNVSCPNVETGLVMGADPGRDGSAVERAPAAHREAADREAHAHRQSTPAPWPRPPRSSGADAVSLINTLKGMALAPAHAEPWLGGRTGGAVGPAVRAVALEQVAAVAARVAIPVIGMGGIASGRNAADFLAAGAALVAVGTESFRDPAAGTADRVRARRDCAVWTGADAPNRCEDVAPLRPIARKLR